MKIDIKPEHIATRHCLEDLIGTIASYWGRGNMLMFSGAWDFKYTRSGQDLFGTRITTGWTEGELELFQKYHGISLLIDKKAGPLKTLEIVNRQLAVSQPIVIYIDSYFCPWTPSYNKFHNSHCCLIIGINHEKGLLCLDPNITNRCVELDFKDFQAGTSGFMLPELTDCEFDDSRADVLIKLCIDKSLRDKELMFNNLQDLVSDFKTSFSLDKEIDGYDLKVLGFIPFLRRLTEICNARFNFAELLKYLANQYSHHSLNDFAVDLTKCAVKWQQVLSLMVKGCYAPRVQEKVKDKSIQLLSDIIEMEKRVVDGLRIKANDHVLQQ